MFATISLVKETLSKFEEAQHSITKSNANVTKERMLTFCHQLMSVMPIVSSIVSFEDIGVAPINKDKGTRRNGWGIQ